MGNYIQGGHVVRVEEMERDVATEVVRTEK